MRNFLTTFCYFITLSFNIALAQSAGQDIITCQGETVQLNPNISNNVSWQPVIYLDNPNIHNPTVSGLAQTTDFVMTTNFTNQIINGDFSSGNTDFLRTTALLWEVHGALERSLNLRHHQRCNLRTRQF